MRLISLITTLWFFRSGACENGDDSDGGTETTGAPPRFVHPINDPVMYFAPPSSLRFSNQSIPPLILRCKAQAHPDPEYTWLKEDMPLDLDWDDGNRPQVVDGSLVFLNWTVSDEGTYRCEATNPLGTILSEEIALRPCVPDQFHIANVFDCDSEGLSTMLSFTYIQTANYSCPLTEIRMEYAIDDDSLDTSVWRIDGEASLVEWRESSDNHRHTVNGTFQVALRPFGRYRFRLSARNAFGVGAPLLVNGECVTAERVPDNHPALVSVKGSDSDNLIVSWQRMPREYWNARHFHYIVRYRPKSSKEEWEEATVSNAQQDHLLVQLSTDEPFRRYEVQVQAVNAVGSASAPLMTVEGRSGEGEPQFTPSGFKVIGVRSTSATFSWDPVDRRLVKGNLTAIKIITWATEGGTGDNAIAATLFRRDTSSERLRRRSVIVLKDAATAQFRETLIAPYKLTATVFGLLPNATNLAQICVRNGQHDGKLSEPIAFRLPEGVPNLVGSLEAFAMNEREHERGAVIVARWKRPLRPNGRLLGYRVECCVRENLRRNNCAIRDVEPSETFARVTGVDYSTRYLVIVYGITTVGDGDPSSTDVKTLSNATSYKLPVQPLLKESDPGRDHINVTMTPGQLGRRDRRPVGNDLYVQFKQSDAHNWTDVFPRGDNLTVELTNLSPGTKYDVMVVALMQGPGELQRITKSAVAHIFTIGQVDDATTWGWYVCLVLLFALLVILCAICVLSTHIRAVSYNVMEEEHRYGRLLYDEDDNCNRDGSQDKSRKPLCEQYQLNSFHGSDNGKF